MNSAQSQGPRQFGLFFGTRMFMYSSPMCWRARASILLPVGISWSPVASSSTDGLEVEPEQPASQGLILLVRVPGLLGGCQPPALLRPVRNGLYLLSNG